MGDAAFGLNKRAANAAPKIERFGLVVTGVHQGGISQVSSTCNRSPPTFGNEAFRFGRIDRIIQSDVRALPIACAGKTSSAV
jgi:hypothetical protein